MGEAAFGTVKVEDCWQALCEGCGWHTPACSPKSWVVQMADLHRHNCPAGTSPLMGRMSDEALEGETDD